MDKSMIIRRPDRCIVSPLGAQPTDWPMGWAFPPMACPPGWPRSWSVIVSDSRLTFEKFYKCVLILNERGEADTALDGEMVLVSGLHDVRVKLKDGQKWCDCALMQIDDGVADVSRLVFEKACHVKAELYGYEPRKSVEWDWPT